MNKNNKKAAELAIELQKQFTTLGDYELETFLALEVLKNTYAYDIITTNKFSVIYRVINTAIKLQAMIREQQTATNLQISESFANNTNRSELDTTFTGVLEKLDDILFVEFSNVEYNTSDIPSTTYKRLNYLKFYIWTNSNYTGTLPQNQEVIDIIGNNENVGYLAFGDIQGFYTNDESQSVPTAFSLGVYVNITITINYVIDSQEPLDFDANNRLQAECQRIADVMFSGAGVDIFYSRFLGSTNSISGILARQILISDGITTLTNTDWITPAGTKNIITIQTARIDL